MPRRRSPSALKTSVLINNYNNAPFLGECVESVLSQVHPADEIIVYDDGSSDNSRDILRGFGSYITLIEGQRVAGRTGSAGQANAINQAFRQSTGDLIFLLDGDDRFHREKIATYTQTFMHHDDAVLVQAPLQQIDTEGNQLGPNTDPIKHHDDYLVTTYSRHDVDFYYPTSALAFRRSYLDAVLPLDFSDNIELPADTRLGSTAPLFGKVVTLNIPYSDWRRHPTSYTARHRAKTRQYAETLKRTRVFNAFCHKHGHAPIRLWRNRRFYRQLARMVLPSFVADFYYQRQGAGR